MMSQIKLMWQSPLMFKVRMLLWLLLAAIAPALFILFIVATSFALIGRLPSAAPITWHGPVLLLGLLFESFSLGQIFQGRKWRFDIAVAKLNVRPGEVVVVTVPDDLASGIVRSLGNRLKSVVPDGNQIWLVNQSGVRFDVTATPPGN